MGWGELELPEFLSSSSLDIQGMSLPQQDSIRLLSACILLAALYLLYYLMFMVNRPLLVGGGGSLKQHLLSHCPSLQQYYWPTVWAFNCHLTTCLRTLLQRRINMVFRRNILTLPDGGQVALDWAGQSGSTISHDAPIMLIMTGLTGSSDSTYVQYLCADGLASGYRPVVFNQRGTGGVLLKTLRVYCSTKVDDLQQVLNTIRHLYPSSAIVGVGISLGGMIFTQYLHQVGCHGDLQAALVISCPWDVHKSRSSLEGKLVNKWLYSRYLCDNMKKLIVSNVAAMDKEILKEIPFDLDHVLESSTVSDIDERMTCPVFEYRCLDDYYDASSNWDQVHKIQTPLLCLTASDDPFVPKASLPFKEFASNPHTVMAVTSHGGHFGYLEGLLPTSLTWMNRVCRQFLVAMAQYKQ